MDKYGYKMLFASTNDDETVVYDLGEEATTLTLSEPDVINMKKQATLTWQ